MAAGPLALVGGHPSVEAGTVRLWSTRTTMEADPPAALGGGVVEAVDAALGFVVGQRWVPRRRAVALIEGVRDVARDVDGDERFDDLIEAALGACDEDPLLGSRLTDLLLDIRNAAGCARQRVGRTS